MTIRAQEWPVRTWHLLLLPAILVANHLFMVTRHEACHGAVARAFGAEIAEFHVWPPRAGNLSWITFGFRAIPWRGAIPAQAAAPYVVAVAIVLGSLAWLRRGLGPGLLRANVILTGVVFPLAEIGVNVAGYWYGANDLYYVFGSLDWSYRAGSTAAIAGLGAVATWVVVAALGRTS